MTKTIITSDNWIDATERTAYFHGGDWEGDAPLSNLRDDKMFNQAISASTAEADTQGEIFLGDSRNVRIVAFPDHNISVNGRIRFRGSNTGKWDNLELDASVAGGASSISVYANEATVIQSGDLIGLNGSSVVYTAGSNHTISGGGTATVSVSPTVSGSFIDGTTVWSLEGNYEQETFLTVVGSHAIDDTTIAVEADSNGAELVAGDYVVFDGSEYAYVVASDLTLAASASGTLTLTDGLEESIAGGAAVYKTEYDSGWFSAVPLFPWGSQLWGEPNLFTGTMTDEERNKRDIATLKVFGDKITKYWKFEISDVDNADGYIALPRMVICPGIEFSINPEYGAAIGVSTDTTSVRSLGGSDFYQRRANRKVMTMSFRNLPNNELYSAGLDLVLDRGIDKQVFVVFNPDDTDNLWRNSMLATMKELSPLQFDYYNHGSKAFSLEQVK